MTKVKVTEDASKSCESKTTYEHSCPYDIIDSTGALCQCCRTCRKGCEANRDQQLNRED